MVDLLFHLGSYHFNEKDLNNYNYGLGLEHKSYIAGVFRNSYNSPSFYVGKDFTIYKNFNVSTGLLTGYHDLSPETKGIIPLIGAKFKFKRFDVIANHELVHFVVKFRI